MTQQATFFEDIAAGSTITAVEPLPADPNMRRIKVNGRIAAKLSASDVESLGLAVGKGWNARLAKQVKELVELGGARWDAMNMLGRRQLSSGELRERLMRREYSAAIVARVLASLKADGWIDDTEFARAIARSLCERKPAAERLIVAKLAKRLIPEDAALRAARETLEGHEAVDEAKKLIAARARTMKGLNAATQTRRLAGALARRGYDEETIRVALHQSGYAIEKESDA
ncbi:MAG TPA: regulatory protein RecX [Phycisphaerales bacterium]|nr:regulatory protein RecX [Phycisphaerales bacterium]HRQ75283.1 regulatory protein RecX [Phycisphaerales bacterium]